MNNWESAFSGRDDINQYGQNALGLFAIALRFKVDDIHSVAAESITDGSGDKKCDLVFIDKDDGVAVIAQCYKSSKVRSSAPANKASDLNTAIAWMLQRPIEKLPRRLQSSAEELRHSIIEGTVKELYVWYVHNLPESQNVADELTTVESTGYSVLRNHFSSNRVKIYAKEVGQSTLEELYEDTLSPILVSERFEIKISKGFEIVGDGWSAYVTAIPAKFLHKVYKKYKTKLFSANVRDYLGSRRSDANINYGIKHSAENDPHDFWVFNNGLTILVNEYDDKNPKYRKKLIIDGISIVNGAQTTGAIGSLRKSPAPEALVPVRFVKTTDTEIVYNIIQYNNSQNKITASDFRSTDRIQKRLREEVNKIPDAEYEGGRRGGHADMIRRSRKIMPSYTVGQALAALHQDPVIAYNQKSNIWVSDKLYARYFNDETTSKHLIFAFSLLRGVEAKKRAIVDKAKKGEDTLTTLEKGQLEYFRNRGATYLFVSAIGGCLEIFLEKKVPTVFRLSFGEDCSPKKAQEIWNEIIDATVPFCEQLKDAFTDGLKNMEKVQSALRTFQSLVQATSSANKEKYKKFAKQVVLRSR